MNGSLKGRPTYLTTGLDPVRSPSRAGGLREWWKVGHEQGVMHRDGWLLPELHAMKPINTRQLHRIVVDAAQAAEITKRVGTGHAAPQLCHPSAGRRRRRPRQTGEDRTRRLRRRAPRSRLPISSVPPARLIGPPMPDT